MQPLNRLTDVGYCVAGSGAWWTVTMARGATIVVALVLAGLLMKRLAGAFPSIMQHVSTSSTVQHAEVELDEVEEGPPEHDEAAPDSE